MGRCRLAPLLLFPVVCFGLGPAPAARATLQHDLARWLEGLTLHFPDNSTEVPGYTLHLLEQACSGFRAKSVQAVKLDTSGTSLTVQLSVHRASVERCRGWWALTPRAGSGSQPMQGRFSWSLVDVSLDLPVVFDASAKRKPLSVRSNGCQVVLRVDNVSFEGSMSPQLEGFWKFVLGASEWLLHQYGCKLPLVLLANLNGHLAEWVQPPQPPRGPAPAVLPPGVPREKLVDWRTDAPGLRGSPDKANAIRLLVSKLTQGTDKFEERLPLRMALPAKQMAQLGLSAAVTLTSFSIAGLGSVSECQILAPVPEEAHSLRSNCSLEMLNVTASMALELTPLEGSTARIVASKGLVLHTSLSVSLKGIHLAAQSVLAADRARAGKLTLGGLIHQPSKVALATLAAVLYAGNVTLLDGVIDDIINVSVSLDGGQLGSELAATLNSLLSTFLSAPGFRFILLKAFRGQVLQTRVTLNQQLSRIHELWPLADPDGGALHEYPTKGIDAVRDRHAFVFGICVFFPVCITAYAVARWLKRPDASAEALQAPCLAQLRSMAHFARQAAGEPAAGSSRRPGSGALADGCSAQMKCSLPLLAFSIMTGGVIVTQTPVINTRAKAFGGLLDVGKPMLDESLIVYSFFQMVHDFWEAGAQVLSAMLIIGCLLVPQVGSLTALFVFSSPMNAKLRGYCCLALTVILRATFVGVCFTGLLICTVGVKTVLPGAEVDVVAEPKVAVPAAIHGSVSLMLLGSLLLHLHREATPLKWSARAMHWECPRKVAILALVGSVVGAFSLSMAFAMEMITLNIDGLLGIVNSLPVSRLPMQRDVWALDLPMMLMNSTDEKSIPFAIGILYYAVVGVVPAVCFASWVLQWGWVVATNQHPHFSRGVLVRYAASLSPLLYCWCCLDVLALAVLIAYLQMDLPVQCVIKQQQKLWQLCQIAQSSLGQPCIHIESQLHAGFGFVLVAAAFSLALFLASERYLGTGPPAEPDALPQSTDVCLAERTQ